MSTIQDQILATERAIRDEVDIPKLQVHLARIGGLQVRQRLEAGESADAIYASTAAKLATETDPSRRRELEGALAAATSADAAPAATRAPTPRPARVAVRAEADDDDDEPPKKKDADPELVRCPSAKCRAMSLKSANFCRVCGADLKPDAEGADDEQAAALARMALHFSGRAPRPGAPEAIMPTRRETYAPFVLSTETPRDRLARAAGIPSEVASRVDDRTLAAMALSPFPGRR